MEQRLAEVSRETSLIPSLIPSLILSPSLFHVTAAWDVALGVGSRTAVACSLAWAVVVAGMDK